MWTDKQIQISVLFTIFYLQFPVFVTNFYISITIIIGFIFFIYRFPFMKIKFFRPQMMWLRPSLSVKFCCQNFSFRQYCNGWPLNMNHNIWLNWVVQINYLTYWFGFWEIVRGLQFRSSNIQMRALYIAQFSGFELFRALE